MGSPQFDIRIGLASESEDIVALVKLVHGDTGGLDSTECIVATQAGKIVGCVRV